MALSGSRCFVSLVVCFLLRPPRAGRGEETLSVGEKHSVARRGRFDGAREHAALTCEGGAQGQSASLLLPFVCRFIVRNIRKTAGARFFCH